MKNYRDCSQKYLLIYMYFSGLDPNVKVQKNENASKDSSRGEVIRLRLSTMKTVSSFEYL